MSTIFDFDPSFNQEKIRIKKNQKLTTNRFQLEYLKDVINEISITDLENETEIITRRPFITRCAIRINDVLYIPGDLIIPETNLTIILKLSQSIEFVRASNDTGQFTGKIFRVTRID